MTWGKGDLGGGADSQTGRDPGSAGHGVADISPGSSVPADAQRGTWVLVRCQGPLEPWWVLEQESGTFRWEQCKIIWGWGHNRARLQGGSHHVATDSGSSCSSVSGCRPPPCSLGL